MNEHLTSEGEVRNEARDAPASQKALYKNVDEAVEMTCRGGENNLLRPILPGKEDHS